MSKGLDLNALLAELRQHPLGRLFMGTQSTGSVDGLLDGLFAALSASNARAQDSLELAAYKLLCAAQFCSRPVTIDFDGRPLTAAPDQSIDEVLAAYREQSSSKATQNEFTINSQIWVELTEMGEHYFSIYLGESPHLKEFSAEAYPVVGGYRRFVFRKFVEIFGPVIGELDQMFAGNQIYLSNPAA